ncbi:hypothetical protein FQR65_LT08978 [Abscondita terminalis]|nr:hypothetical protein FQR65_LT08978 [Abscondita terminalis]
MKGSFEARSKIATLQYNNGHNWHFKSKVLKDHDYGINAKEADLTTYEMEQEVQRILSKMQRPGGSSKNLDYTPLAMEPELSDRQMKHECDRIIEKFRVTVDRKLEIANNTTQQFDDPVYRLEKEERLTASNLLLENDGMIHLAIVW